MNRITCLLFFVMVGCTAPEPAVEFVYETRQEKTKDAASAPADAGATDSAAADAAPAQADAAVAPDATAAKLPCPSEALGAEMMKDIVDKVRSQSSTPRGFLLFEHREGFTEVVFRTKKGGIRFTVQVFDSTRFDGVVISVWERPDGSTGQRTLTGTWADHGPDGCVNFGMLGRARVSFQDSGMPDHNLGKHPEVQAHHDRAMKLLARRLGK